MSSALLKANGPGLQSGKIARLRQRLRDPEWRRYGALLIGGKLLGFNVDRKFSNVLDGLVVVDLRQTEPAVLERYMGREGAMRFRQVHAAKAC